MGIADAVAYTVSKILPSADPVAYPVGEQLYEATVMARALQRAFIDALISGGDGNPRMLADTIGDVDVEFDHITYREAVRPLLAALPERERTMLYLRFFASMTQSQIAERPLDLRLGRVCRFKGVARGGFSSFARESSCSKQRPG